MNAGETSGNVSPSPNDAPQLSLALWSIRYRMIERPAETLSLIEKWGISTVEIAGFFEFEAYEFQKELTAHHMKVCSVVAPPLKTGRDFEFYCKWVDKYLPIFGAKTIIFQSLPVNFRVTETNTHANICNVISDLLIEISQKLRESDVLVGYHCFPHDFQLVDGQSFVSRLFAREVPDNLGLQLDTYWLNVSGIAPSIYAERPVHSVHLNERDAQGRNCLLGTDENKCVKYIHPLIKRESPINWILENDSFDNEAKDNYGTMMNTIHQCITSWPTFWGSLKSFDIQPEKDDQLTELSASPAPVSGESEFVTETTSDSTIYETELNDVLTEFLFGDEPNLDTIDVDYPRLKCYVDERRSPSGGYHVGTYHAERLLFPLFWPAARPGKQIIHLVGGAGAGKSTFIRFFFQHFLPFHETIVSDAAPKSDMAQIHAKALRQHIPLYIDLRRGMTTNEIAPYLYDKLGDSIVHAATQLGFAIDSKKGEQYSEAWVKRQISRLAKEVEGDKRKWYISWVLDNSDQMEEAAQNDLIKLLFDWIPEKPSTVTSSAPVIDGQRRELWRIIIPIRPETSAGLAPMWTPLINRECLTLDPIDHDILVDKRAKYFNHKVSDSTKSPFVDVREIYPELTKKEAKPRPHLDMVVSSEKAPEMQESLRVAYGGKSEILGGDGIPDNAKTIFDQFVNDSARRRLYLVRKVFSSHIFHERRQQGLLSPFYFFESILRGDDDQFKPNDPDNLVLNLYNLGDHPENHDPYSIFVGIHSIFLLNRGMEWKDVKSTLERIGYPAKHLSQCETYLKGKELLKEVASVWRIELSVVQGHWALLKQRAYTDNMAVACAIAWGSPEKVKPTDPLYTETLLPRFNSSIWFLQKIWEAECALARYPSDPEVRRRCGDFNAFLTTRRTLNLPSITYKVADEYLTKMRGLSKWLKPKLVIDKEKENWDLNIEALEKLVKKSRKPNALDTRR